MSVTHCSMTLVDQKFAWTINASMATHASGMLVQHDKKNSVKHARMLVLKGELDNFQHHPPPIFFQRGGKKKIFYASRSIRRRSDYITGFIAPAIGPNKSKKLTRLIVLAHNIHAWGVLSGKVDTGKCGPDRVLFWPFRFTNGLFYLKIGLDIGRIFAKCIIFDEFFL